MKIIGLTGGIGSGKSTVSDFLRKKGYQVIDADQLSRQITKKGTTTLNNIVNEFGDEILFQDGNLNRKKLGSLIFHDKEKKIRLEKLTTNVVIERIKKQIDFLRLSSKCDILFIDAPLLFETGADMLTDMVWLITADEETRIQRVVTRDNVKRNDVMSRIQNQMKDEMKIKRSQEVIENSKGKENLYIQIEALLKKYVERK